MKLIDPNLYNIKSKLIIEDRGDEICIVINRKSRIIMKDGERIIGYASSIQKTTPKPITIETTAPVYSKTKAFLLNHRIPIKTI